MALQNDRYIIEINKLGCHQKNGENIIFDSLGGFYANDKEKLKRKNQQLKINNDLTKHTRMTKKSRREE